MYMQKTTYFFIDSDTAGMVCGRVYVMMQCTLVCPVVYLPYDAAPGLLLWTQRAGDIDSSAYSGHTAVAAPQQDVQQQCEQFHVYI